MSSDESDQDESGSNIYFVKRRLWRSKKLVEYLKAIDADQNTTNGYGNTRAGNPIRKRIRKTGNKASVRGPVCKLPTNFYEDLYIAGLSNRDKKELGMKEEMEIPDFEIE